MRFALLNCRKSLYWAILFVGITIIGTPTASALVIGGYNFGFLCGPVHSPPITVNVGSNFRYITASTTAKVLKSGADGRRQIRHFMTLKSLTPNGTTAWKRSLVVISYAVALVDLDDDPPTYSLPDTVSLGDRTASPAQFLAAECSGVSVASSGNQKYLTVVLGTTSSVGGPSNTNIIQGRDKTVLNVSILNINNGNVVKTFQVRPKPSRYLQMISSGIYDIDNDFNDELVLAYVKFVGATRYDFIFEHYNIVTGALERTTTTTQYDNDIIVK